MVTKSWLRRSNVFLLNSPRICFHSAAVKSRAELKKQYIFCHYHSVRTFEASLSTLGSPTIIPTYFQGRNKFQGNSRNYVHPVTVKTQPCSLRNPINASAAFVMVADKNAVNYDDCYLSCQLVVQKFTFRIQLLRRIVLQRPRRRRDKLQH